MKIGGAVLLFALAPFTANTAAQEFFDRLGDLLTLSSPQGDAGARLSGALDLESYHYQLPAPGLVYSPDGRLFNPRLTLFLDAQAGSAIYFFAQARIDRGFDPSDGDMQMRLDEYALRYTPAADGRVNFQIGTFAAVVGNWIRRHGSWENPFITAPLVYENLTGVWDVAAARSSGILLSWAHVLPPFSTDEYTDKHLRVPIVWGPAYAPGVAVFGEINRFSYAAEIKQAALSSRPESWKIDGEAWRYPTLSTRISFRPNMMWDLGVSVSVGTYLLPSARSTIPTGYGLNDYRQFVVGHDIGFAWHHWQVWAEAYQARFQIPRVGNADTFSWYVSAKYKFTPRFSCGVRWNRQTFGEIRHGSGMRPWGRDTWRIDLSPAWRFTTHVQLKLQYSLKHENRAARARTQLWGLQLTTRF